MKKIQLLVSGLLLSVGAFAQAPKFVLFEHFTQASCGPCAAQNPGFETNILNANSQTVRHIAYHTSWPGVDPMNAANATEVADRVTYYNVSGVPDVVLQGNYKQGGPASMTQADVDAQFSMGSPIKIEVTEVDNGATRDVTVVVKTIGTAPTGTFKLYTAVVEDPIDYTTAPGSNGELHFPNVFRKMYPSTAGENVTLAPVGGAVTFNYTYNIDPTWVAANVKVVSFLQETTSKEVLNVGSVGDPMINYTLSNPNNEVSNVAAGTATSFTFTSGNSGSASEDFVYTLTNDAPADWTSNFTIDGNSFGSTATVTSNAGSTANIVVNVTPGATRGVVTYTLTVSSVSNPGSPVMSKKVYVISGVTDLIVNNSGYVGDGATAGSAANWGAVYTDALAAANNSGYASTNDMVMQKAIDNLAFTGVNNVYYNAGWTFPALTDGVVLALQNFMDGGGNLFISGQDIGWEIADVATSGFITPAKTTFFSDYMHATYVADGGTTNSTLTTVSTDPIFSGIASAPINNFYGGTYFFPDQINAADTAAKVIFKYGTSARVGGIRAQTANYKMVYICAGMEMLNNTNSNEILKRAHDWFYGYQGTASVKELESIQAGMGQNYPNPSNGLTSITFENIDQAMNFELADVTGKLVYAQQIAKGTNRIELSTTSFSAGKYVYRLIDAKGNSVSKSMIIK
jgi:hypothetical protein